MEIKNISRKDISDYFINAPKLAYLGLSDSDLVDIYENGVYTVSDESSYRGIYHENHLIGIIKWENFTRETVNCHLYLHPELHGKGLSGEVFRQLTSYFKSLGKINAVSFVPEPCTHVTRALEAFGFTKAGFIPSCQTWRNELCGLYIYSFMNGEG